MLTAQFADRALVIEREILIMTDTAKILGSHLAVIRHQRGMTQEQAAAAAQINPRTLKSIELGEANANLSTLESIAVAYGVTLSAIFEPWKSGAANAEPDILCKKMREILKNPHKAQGLKLLINSLYKEIK
jgi:transcriptional regulator with XRE-family HTH domain